MKNFVQDGNRITFPKTGLTGPNSPILSGDPVVTTGGRVAGVAVANAVPISAGPADDGNVVVQLTGVFQFTVTSTHHTMVAGATCYIDPSTGALTDDFTDVPFGTVLDAVAAGTAVSVRVRLFGATPGAAGADS